MKRCDIYGCKDGQHRTGLFNLKGSEDDYICNRCKFELTRFARSIQIVANKIRMEEQ